MSGNQIGRSIILLLHLGVAFCMARYGTPELEGVDNKDFYRVLYGYAWLRGLAYIFFDMMNLFPLE